MSIRCSTARVYMGLVQVMLTSSRLPISSERIIHRLFSILRNTNFSMNRSPSEARRGANQSRITVSPAETPFISHASEGV